MEFNRYPNGEYIKKINELLKKLNEEENIYINEHRSLNINNKFRFIKKIIRKLIKWYVNPIIKQQSDFNINTKSTFNLTSELLTQINMQMQEFTNEIMVLKNYKIEAERQNLFTNEQIEKQNREYIEILLKLSELEKETEIIQSRNNDLVSRLLEYEKEHQLSRKYHNEIIDKLTKYDSILIDDNNFFNKKTYGQAGEDSILAYILKVLGITEQDTSYIDLGANHAKEMSNTFYFYENGAKGILVEANPELIPELKFYRNRDLILNYVVDTVDDTEVDFYILSGDGLSTPDYEAAKSFCEINPSIKIVDKKLIKTISYNSIVEKYLGKSPTILSIDIEGKELDILNSINFDNNRPLLIVIEMISYDTKLNYNTKNYEVLAFLESKGYEEYAFTGINSIFIDKKYINGL